MSGIQAYEYPDVTREQDYRDLRPEIIKLLDNYKNSKHSVLAILCKESGYELDLKWNFIFDEGGRLKTAGELLEKEYGIRRDTVKCPKCNENLTTDIILQHLQSEYRNGHKFSIEGVSDFLLTISN